MYRSEDVAGWLAAILDRMPMPDAPVGAPWDFSAATLLTPRLPPGTRWLAGRLDRFGAVRLTPRSITLDTVGPISWSDIVEVRTRPRLDALTGAARDTLITNLARLVPVGSGPARRILGDAADAVLAIVQRARREDNDGAAPVPVELVYRNRRRRQDIVTPGPLSAPVLALPRVAASILATAERHAVPISQ